MITKLLWGLVLVVLIAILVGYSQLPTVDYPSEDILKCKSSLLCHAINVPVLVIQSIEEIGKFVTELGKLSPTILGLLTCLTVPLALLGLWALGKLEISTNPFGGYGGRR